VDKYYIVNIKTYNSFFKLFRNIKKEIDSEATIAKRMLINQEVYKIATADNISIYINNTLEDNQIISAN